MSLPQKRSSGYDNIHNMLLKNLRFVVCETLTILINKSLGEGVFPSRLKKAIVTPLYKGKEQCLVTNYRPISLLITLSKVYEKAYHDRLDNFLEKTNIFYRSQYGFRKTGAQSMQSQR